MTRRDLPNTMARLKPATSDSETIADAAIRRAVLVHRDRYLAYCAVLKTLAAHCADWSLGLLVVELSNRIDGSGDRCTAEVIASFPREDETTRLIAAAQQICQAAARPACSRDVRPER